MHGKSQMTLSKDERAALVEALERGGDMPMCNCSSVGVRRSLTARELICGEHLTPAGRVCAELCRELGQ